MGECGRTDLEPQVDAAVADSHELHWDGSAREMSGFVKLITRCVDVLKVLAMHKPE